MADNEEDPKSGAGAVGYGRPPRSRRFGKGRSGNPAGKRKGTKNRPRSIDERLNALVLAEAYRPVKWRLDGIEVTIPLAQALLKSLGTAALKGEARALATFFKMMRTSAAETAAKEELLEGQREKAAAEEPVEIEFHIVDEQGRRTGEVHRLSELSPGPKGGIDK